MCNSVGSAGSGQSVISGADSHVGQASSSGSANALSNAENNVPNILSSLGGSLYGANGAGQAGTPINGVQEQQLQQLIGQLKDLVAKLTKQLDTGHQASGAGSKAGAGNQQGAGQAGDSIRDLMQQSQKMLQQMQSSNAGNTGHSTGSSNDLSSLLRQLIQLLNQLLGKLGQDKNNAGDGANSKNSLQSTLQQLSQLLNQLQQGNSGSNSGNAGNSLAGLGGNNNGANASVGGNGAAAATNINGNNNQVANLALNGVGGQASSGQNLSGSNQFSNVANAGGSNSGGNASIGGSNSGANAGVGGNGASAATNINGNNNTVINIAINANQSAPSPAPKPATSSPAAQPSSLQRKFLEAIFDKEPGRLAQSYMAQGWKLENYDLDVSTLSKDGKTIQVNSPVAFDLNGDGKIGTTSETTAKDGARSSLGKTVSFDIDADGSQDDIEWMNGDGDGLLVDNSDGNAAQSMDGARLFGDQGGKYSDGYAKLSQRDGDGDGNLTGAELDGLNVWVDNGDAQVQDGELKSLADLGVTSISAKRNDVQNAKGETLMQSKATMNGNDILTEDVWFGKK